MKPCGRRMRLRTNRATPFHTVIPTNVGIQNAKATHTKTTLDPRVREDNEDLVPTLCLGMRFSTLCVVSPRCPLAWNKHRAGTADSSEAELRHLHSQAERGNECETSSPPARKNMGFTSPFKLLTSNFKLHGATPR